MTLTALGSIRRKLIAAAAVSALSLLAVGLSALAFWNRMDDAQKRDAFVETILQDTFQLTTVGHDYTLERSDRLVRQWRRTHEHTGQLLEAAPALIPEELRKSLGEHHRELKAAFDAIVAATDGNRPMEAVYGSSYLLARLERMVDEVNRLSESSRRERQSLLDLFLFALLLIPVLFLAGSASFSAAVIRGIVTRADRLKAGAQAIAGGDFSARLGAGGDAEFAELAGAFDHMAERLQIAYAALERERLSLEERVAQRTAELQESERRFRIMADSSPILIWVDNGRGEVDFVNRAYREFFGVSDEQIRAPGGWQPLVHPDDTPHYVGQLLAAVRDRTPFAAAARVRHAGGSWRWITSHGVPRFSAGGAFLGHVGSSVDITDRKQAEIALLEAGRRKDEFLATLAHELRNPLTPVRNAVHLMRDEDLPAEDRRWARDVIDRQIVCITRLVDDLLDLSRIDHDKLELRRQNVELEKVVCAALEGSRPLIDKRRHELTVSLPHERLTIHGDAIRLAQVLENLLNNAAKYTPEGGRISLAAERSGDAVAITVKDTGVGIAEGDVEKLFEMFSQVGDPLTRVEGGLGIGLALVKRLVEMHGGQVEARSAGPGKGSEFTVRLPLVAAQPDSSERRNEPRKTGASRLRILVVDDNRDAAFTTATLLARRGDDVRTAHDGEAAVQTAAEFRPQVALLDVGLPRMSGYDAARYIRSQPWGRDMVLIAVTGWGQQADRRRAEEAGFDRHMLKPVDPEALIAALAEARTRLKVDLPQKVHAP